MGLVSRPGMLHEFGTGSAVGWGLLLLTIVPSVFIGGLGVTLWTGAHQWFLLILDLLVLAIAALCEELIFRGYPFQRLMDAVGPTLGSVFISICFVVVHYQPDMPHAAVFALFLLSMILCIAYLRTRALWLPWGLHFAWNAAMGPLFGLPLSGYSGFAGGFSPVVQSLPQGPDALTGADYGPEGSVVAVLVLCFGLWLIMRVTREYAFRAVFRWTSTPRRDVSMSRRWARFRTLDQNWCRSGISRLRQRHRNPGRRPMVCSLGSCSPDPRSSRF
jgi:hypothetical protein